ncbi:MAG TPA: hypothetical protein V6C71_09170 [Coleofasciculaceae cyanobacterium]|jgi:hypothetical protein
MFRWLEMAMLGTTRDIQVIVQFEESLRSPSEVAQKESLGIWSDNPQAPWDWR